MNQAYDDYAETVIALVIAEFSSISGPDVIEPLIQKAVDAGLTGGQIAYNAKLIAREIKKGANHG